MNDKQLIRRCINLAKAECANYQSKECIPEDRRCHVINPNHPTIQEGALDCDWFLEAVLPCDKELSRAVWQELIGQDAPSKNRGRRCETCQRTFVPTSPRQKYCIECGTFAKQRRSREKQRRYDEKKRTGTTA